MVLPTASAAELASIAAAGNQRPAGPRVNLGRAGCCSGPKQVALRSSPVGDPTLGGAALRPSPPHLSGARAERLGNHIIKHHLGESKGERRFLGKKFMERGERILARYRGIPSKDSGCGNGLLTFPGKRYKWCCGTGFSPGRAFMNWEKGCS